MNDKKRDFSIFILGFFAAVTFITFISSSVIIYSTLVDKDCSTLSKPITNNESNKNQEKGPWLKFQKGSGQ